MLGGLFVIFSILELVSRAMTRDWDSWLEHHTPITCEPCGYCMNTVRSSHGHNVSAC